MLSESVLMIIHYLCSARQYIFVHTSTSKWKLELLQGKLEGWILGYGLLSQATQSSWTIYTLAMQLSYDLTY
jgi:hypothetical protein